MGSAPEPSGELSNDISSSCLKLTNRWMHMGNTIDRMLAKRLRLLKHIEESKPVDAPTEALRIEAAFAAVTVVVSATFTKVQAKDIIISQHSNAIERMVCRRCILVSPSCCPKTSTWSVQMTSEPCVGGYRRTP